MHLNSIKVEVPFVVKRGNQYRQYGILTSLISLLIHIIVKNQMFEKLRF